MSWEELFDAYLVARRHGKPSAIQPIVQEARRHLATATAEDWKTLRQALQHDERKWLVAAIFAQAPVPKRLFPAMIQAAIAEVNPSLNRYFVAPCLASYGYRPVNEALLAYVETGSNAEKAGAINALYWAQMPLTFPLEKTTPDSQCAYVELADLWQRKRVLFLQLFVTNPNLDVRRSLIPSLHLAEADYPAELQPLVAQAIQIARHHPDDYIRHRVEVQLGMEHLLYPLPERAAETGPTEG